MKRGILLVLVLLLIPMLSAMTVDIKSSYDRGETIITKISGNLIDPLSEENVFFYRNHVKIPIDYDIGNIGDDYYVRASLIGKDAGNYSLRIKNVRYYLGGQVTSQEVIKNFTITSNTALFSVKPAFFITNKNFSTQVQSLTSPIVVNINVPSGISSPSSISLSSGQTKTINFASSLTQTTSSFITLSSGQLSYTIPFYFLYIAPPEPPEPPIQPDCTINSDCGNGYFCNSSQECEIIPIEPQPYCGDNNINVPGELCDGTDILVSCSSYGFNAGTISCNPQGSTNECTIDISNCYTQSNVECTTGTEDQDCSSGQVCVNNKCSTPAQEPEDIPCGNNAINLGELCDNNNWGAISSCTNFGFDKGTLSCSSSCTFNTSKCENNPVVYVPQCEDDNDCSSNQQCIDEKCVNNPPVECEYNVDCGSSVFECKSNKCYLKVQCDDDDQCGEFEGCEDGRCTLKEGDECIRNIDCKADHECILGFCEKIIECRFNSECDNDEECKDNKCIFKPECENNDDCDNDEICEDNRCEEVEEECDVDFDCRNGYECIGNSCFEKPNRCTTNTNCDTPEEYCFKGYCSINLSYKNTTNTIDPLVSKTCSELDGKFCTESQTCEGNSRNIKSSVCCLGSCKGPSGGSSSNKIIGWAIIIIIGVFILWFMRRFKSSTAKKTPDFLRKS